MKPMIALAALAALTVFPAHAATISVTNFSKAAYDSAAAGYSGAVAEDFEGFSEGNIADGWSASAVGSFASLGGTGSGGTVNGSVASGNFAGNDGSELALRDGNVYGRQSTTDTLSGDAGDDMFLDSNDTFGIRWNVDIGGAFDRILFTLADAADVGATLHIDVDGTTESLANLGNGAIRLVEIVFDAPLTMAELLFRTTTSGGALRTNDGFSIDDLLVGSTLSSEPPNVVPLPAGAWLLLSGFGMLTLMRRRRA